MYNIYLNKRVPLPHSRRIRKLLLIMKLTTLILITVILHVSATAVAQKVTLNEKNARLVDVFNDINTQTGYDFAFTTTTLTDTKPVTLNVRNEELSDVLTQIFQGQNLDFTIENKSVVIKPRETSFLDNLKNKAAQLLALPADIKGTVTDTTGSALPGASVSLAGTNFSATTNNKGEFTLAKVPQSKYILVVTYIGYAKLERTIETEGKDLNLKLTLHNSSSELDQVQVIAYGETTQRYSVGSISQVTAAEIEEQPVSNPLQALEGRVPGMVITQSSGLPGASIQVQIRGQNTLNPNPNNIQVPDNPLFIIDGVPTATQNSNINQLSSLAAPSPYGPYNNLFGGISPFNSIDPSDIESIEVLRDADATAIYGSRGANGVVLITTKKGKAGKTQFTASVTSGESEATHLMPMMNIMQYLFMRHQALNNDGVTPSISNGDYDLLLFDTTKNTNWQKLLAGGTAQTTDAHTTFSGGNSNTQFFIGSGYHHESYIVPGGYADNRASFDANIHHTSENKKLTLDFSANYSYDQNNSSGDASGFYYAATLPPDYPSLTNPNGSLNWSYNGIDLNNILGNPLAYLKESYLIQTYNLVSHLQVGYTIIPGLDIRASLGYNTTNANETSLTPIAAQDPADNPTSESNFGTNDYVTWIIEPQAEYKKLLFQGKLDILIGGTFQQVTNSSTQITGYDYPNDALMGSISAAGKVGGSSNYSLYKYNAAFARFNYIWHDKYIIDVTGRRDGSSRFGPDKQFGNFGSLAGGWIFSEEDWLKQKFSFLSFGKLHASYGTTGSDNIGNYQYLSNYAPGNGVSYQGSAGYIPLNLLNPNYSWAIDKKLEGGIDLGFFKDRILVNATYFVDRTSDQLIESQLPSQTGFQNVIENLPATVQNTGVEIQLNTKNIASRDFTWNTSFNLSVPNNKLIAFPGLATSPYAGAYVIGKSTSVIQGFRFAGVNPQTGVYQYYTANGSVTNNPTFGSGLASGNPGDETIIGNLSPKFYGGFRNSVSYKGIQLDLFFQFTKQLGYNYLSEIYERGLPVGGAGTNMPAALLNSWQRPGSNSNIEQLTESYGSNAYTGTIYYEYSNAALTDASFIRLKTVSISYLLKSSWVKKIGMSSCRVYLNGQNLWTITGYKGNDPETQSFYGMPTLLTLVAGAQFNF